MCWHNLPHSRFSLTLAAIGVAVYMGVLLLYVHACTHVTDTTAAKCAGNPTMQFYGDDILPSEVMFVKNAGAVLIHRKGSYRRHNTRGCRVQCVLSLGVGMIKTNPRDENQPP